VIADVYKNVIYILGLIGGLDVVQAALSWMLLDDSVLCDSTNFNHRNIGQQENVKDNTNNFTDVTPHDHRLYRRVYKCRVMG